MTSGWRTWWWPTISRSTGLRREWLPALMTVPSSSSAPPSRGAPTPGWSTTPIASGGCPTASRRSPHGGRRPSPVPGGTGGHRQGAAIHVGPVAAGDLHVAARAFADWIRLRRLTANWSSWKWRGPGLSWPRITTIRRTCWWFAGVSDYVGKLKSELDAGQDAADVEDAWRRYAVRNAVEYLVLLLSSSGFPWRIGSGADARRGGSLLTRMDAASRNEPGRPPSRPQGTTTTSWMKITPPRTGTTAPCMMITTPRTGIAR
jgi:hypothetical protein